MTLPGSGPLAISAFAAEYGVPASTPLSGYIGRPSLPGAPPIAFSQFYNASNVTFVPNGGTTGASGFGSASCTLSCSQAATWTYTLASGTGGFVDIPSGSTAGSITFTVTAPGAGTRTCTWNVHGEAAGVARDFTVTVDAMGTG